MLRLQVETRHPSARTVGRAVDIFRSGGVVIFPTDTTYGMGCDFFSKQTIERIYQLKGMDRRHPLSFICSDFSEISSFAVVNNRNYRILRHHLPGPYTFVLPASRDVPKIMQSNARTVGVRVPKNQLCLDLIKALGHPIVTTTVARSHDGINAYLNDPDEIMAAFKNAGQLLLDGGPLYGEPSSVVDLTEEHPVILRKGAGDLSWLV